MDLSISQTSQSHQSPTQTLCYLCVFLLKVYAQPVNTVLAGFEPTTLSHTALSSRRSNASTILPRLNRHFCELIQLKYSHSLIYFSQFLN